MRVITLNLNGIRSAASKGFFQWMRRQEADVVCVQETRAHPEQCSPQMLRPKGYFGFLHCGERKGYAGVAIYTRRQPDNVRMGMGVSDFDNEGRYVQVDFGPLSIASLYLPSGSSSPARLAAKLYFMREFYPFLRSLRDAGREHLICGDWNIAHREIDLKNWRSNRKNSGFLPEERDWLTGIFDELNYVDVFRALNVSPEQYTWWSNRGDAWAKNVGWRIDYQIATPGLASAARAESIYKRKRFSDHAPLTIDYEYEL
jgi:exodeoxyribonuclease III